MPRRDRGDSPGDDLLKQLSLYRTARTGAAGQGSCCAGGGLRAQRHVHGSRGEKRRTAMYGNRRCCGTVTRDDLSDRTLLPCPPCPTPQLPVDACRQSGYAASQCLSWPSSTPRCPFTSSVRQSLLCCSAILALLPSVAVRITGCDCASLPTPAIADLVITPAHDWIQTPLVPGNVFLTQATRHPSVSNFPLTPPLLSSPLLAWAHVCSLLYRPDMIPVRTLTKYYQECPPH